MTPKFSQAVDPVFLHILDLLDRISEGHEPSPPDERLRIRVLLDQAEAILGGGAEWEHAKYALASWIDEMLVDAPWQGAEWWSNQVLEMELFHSRLCYEQFYVRAKEAAALSSRNALEIFYVCVVLGFRGLYRDTQMSEHLIASLALPSDLDQWTKQTSLSIRLGQGRPALAGVQRNIAGAGPLPSASSVLWAGVTTLTLAVCLVVALRLLW